MSTLRTVIKNLQFSTRNVLGARAWSAIPLYLWPVYRRRAPNQNTALCLDGFSRSANSFLYNAVVYWNPGLPISHHLHVPATIEQAVTRGIPTILLIRDPIDAVTSNIVADTALSPRIALEAWISYYTRVLPYVDGCVIATFDAALDVTPVLEETNRKFGTRLHYEVLTAEVKKKLRGRLEEHNRNVGQPSTLVAVPSAEKEIIKSNIRPQIARLSRLDEAYRLYREVAGRSPWYAAPAEART